MTQAGPGVPRVFDEVGRINRMRCKDFLWEFDLMKDIAGTRQVYDERMMRTAVAMYFVQEKVSGAAIAALNRVFPPRCATLRSSVVANPMKNISRMCSRRH